MTGFYAALFVVCSAVAVAGLVYDLLWGRDRRLFRSREYCYKDSKVPPMSDEEFCEHPAFSNSAIPKRYIAAKRFQLCDHHLDYPPQLLHPDMRWDEIPLEPYCWGGDDFDDLMEYIKDITGERPEGFLGSKTVAEVIADFYEIEREMLWADAGDRPLMWCAEMKELKRRIQHGDVPSDYLERATVAEVIADVYECRATQH